MDERTKADRIEEQEALQLLAAVDEDRATLKNARGFSKTDSKRGHRLAKTPITLWTWHDDLWAGERMIRYFDQIRDLRIAAKRIAAQAA